MSLLVNTTADSGSTRHHDPLQLGMFSSSKPSGLLSISLLTGGGNSRLSAFSAPNRAAKTAAIALAISVFRLLSHRIENMYLFAPCVTQFVAQLCDVSRLLKVAASET
ncbi:hypothetical protein MPL3365_130593 [Mesorhizobium plurifarium]|uniref:Uncharacterized protein n=1 Tax=Mesorhizobium plurifarium TaxID=69974 RepID=A0A090G3L2_MESPL|nr:hypothetical protein MPL3365_130593 [Mesorhizobium plurifarium]